MSQGKLIIIESGSDASGKATQTQLLYEKLIKDGKSVRKISYPNYKSPASSLVKMYLAGDFGTKAYDVNAYAASVFFAIDRFASYHAEWKEFYETGGIVLSDRYTTSNMVHQGVKLFDDMRDQYLDWLCDLEYGKFGLPKPDCVIFLDVDPEISLHLMEGRANKITGQKKKDIHESDVEYLKKTYANSILIAKKYNWITIKCSNESGLRSKEDINTEILTKVHSIIF
ncbi:MAG: deoxynucleoside kinase [Eubacteriales bacterium]|nr:deoxynucleoside kinase [Eubacteriales bacterium]